MYYQVPLFKILNVREAQSGTKRVRGWGLKTSEEENQKKNEKKLKKIKCFQSNLNGEGSRISSSSGDNSETWTAEDWLAPDEKLVPPASRNPPRPEIFLIPGGLVDVEGASLVWFCQGKRAKSCLQTLKKTKQLNCLDRHTLSSGSSYSTSTIPQTARKREFWTKKTLCPQQWTYSWIMILYLINTFLSTC